MKHRWLTGTTATDHDLVSELRSHRVKARMRRGIERVQLAKRIESLMLQASQEGDETDIPQDPTEAAQEAFTVEGTEKGTETPPATIDTRREFPLGGSSSTTSTANRLSRAAKSDIFRAVVIAKAKEEKAMKQLAEMEQHAASNASSAKSGSSGESHAKKPSR